MLVEIDEELMSVCSRTNGGELRLSDWGKYCWETVNKCLLNFDMCKLSKGNVRKWFLMTFREVQLEEYG